MHLLRGAHHARRRAVAAEREHSRGVGDPGCLRLQGGARNRSSARNRPCTYHSPYTLTPLHPTPHTRRSYLHPETLHHTPYNLKLLHPTPHTLHPAPYLLHPTPYILHPTPYTPNHKPYTLIPTPRPLTLFHKPLSPSSSYFVTPSRSNTTPHRVPPSGDLAGARLTPYALHPLFAQRIGASQPRTGLVTCCLRTYWLKSNTIQV